MLGNNIKFKYKLIFVIKLIIFNNDFIINLKFTKKRIGIIGLEHSQNVGNNLLKFAISIKLTELGYDPYIVGKQYKKHNISFINSTTKIRLIKNFSEIKENEFDLLMVNSDQTWRKYNSDFYDIAFLKFAEKWKKTKFIYGASLGFNDWKLNRTDEVIAKTLLVRFAGLSVREITSIDLIEKHLGFKAQFVLDPTLLINKKYYENLIKDYKSDIVDQQNNNCNYIFVYILSNRKRYIKYLKYIKSILGLKIVILTIYTKNQVKEFLYGIINSEAVLTDSYHGTIFSIIFNKPFISFSKLGKRESRFNSLNKVFNIQDRIFKYNTNPPIYLLKQPLILNHTKLNILKQESINYLTKSLAD